MSEEEKETMAINSIMECLEFGLNIDREDIKELLKIIEKQQKEIEEMREELQMYVDTNLIKEKLEIEIEKLKDKNKTLESLLQGNLYEMYLYYKELASKY